MKKKLNQHISPATKKVEEMEPSANSDNATEADGYFLNLYEQILENSREIAYCISLPDFQFEFISPSIKNLVGISREEIIGSFIDKILLFVHADDREPLTEHYKSLINDPKQSQQSIIYKIKPPKGIYRWIEDHHTVIFVPESKTNRIIGSLHDITDQKLTEDALNRSRERLYMAIEATNDGMWDWRLDTNEIYFDQRFYTMLGYDPYEFEGSFQEWMKRIHPEDLKSVQKQLEKHLNGKSSQWNIEYRFKAKSGSWVWMLNRGKVFDWDDNDKPRRMVGTHSDISQRKKTEITLKQNHDELLLADQKLREANYELLRLNNDLKTRNSELEEIYQQLQTSEERFRQLAENMQDIFWLRDKDKLLYINPAFDLIWGRSNEMVMKNPAILQKWIHPDDLNQFNTWVSMDKFENNPSYFEQYRIVKPNGDIRWLWSRMFPIYKNNELYRIAGIATDITELKKFEEELTFAKEKALESDRLKSAFLANISHEIRTPMNGIIGFANLLKERVLPAEKQDQFIDIITQSSISLLHIVEDLVDISKLEANQLQIIPRNFDLNELLNNLYDQFIVEKQLYGKAHIELIKDANFTDFPLIIHSDDTRLSQIISNLISNALKFTDKGYIKYGYVLKSNKEIEFYVTDTGMGISDDVKPFIYEQFRQHETTFSRKFGGAGLGLSICKGLVKLMGGQIWFESSVNVGSTFHFSIPVEFHTKEIKLPYKDQQNEHNWNGYTILIVEDDIVSQEYYQTIIKSTGALTITARNGTEAIKVITSNSNINIVLLDLQLPDMEGYEIFRKIKEISPSLPIIAQTANTHTEDLIRCIQMGFSDYITKPVNRNNLLLKIEYFLSKK